MFSGLDLKQNRDDIDLANAVEAVNCFPHAHKIGTLGARAGKTFSQTTAYKDVVTGYSIFRIPNGGELATISTNNGEVTDTENGQTTAPTTYVTGDTASGKALTPTSLTLSYPSTSAEVNCTFTDTSIFSHFDSLFLTWGYGYAVNHGAWSGIKTLRFEFGVNVNGTPQFLATYDWETDFNASLTFGSEAMAALHSAYGTITGACFRISWPGGWPTGAAGGDSVVLSSLLAG